MIHQNYSELDFNDLVTIKDDILRNALNFCHCDKNSFFSMDLESLKLVLDTASSIHQQQQQVSDVAVNYIRHVQETDQEAVFVQLSEFVSQVHSKDALYLYGLSLTFDCKLIRCLSSINAFACPVPGVNDNISSINQLSGFV